MRADSIGARLERESEQVVRRVWVEVGPVLGVVLRCAEMSVDLYVVAVELGQLEAEDGVVRLARFHGGTIGGSVALDREDGDSFARDDEDVRRAEDAAHSA